MREVSATELFIYPIKTAGIAFLGTVVTYKAAAIALSLLHSSAFYAKPLSFTFKCVDLTFGSFLVNRAYYFARYTLMIWFPTRFGEPEGQPPSFFDMNFSIV